MKIRAPGLHAFRFVLIKYDGTNKLNTLKSRYGILKRRNLCLLCFHSSQTKVNKNFKSTIS
jgi:hypothetical protein